MPCCLIICNWPPWPVGWQLQYRMLGTQVIAPVRQLPVFLPRFQPVPLPDGIVGIADPQRIETWCFPLRMSQVVDREFIKQYLQRCAIGDYVMHDYHQDMLIPVAAVVYAFPSFLMRYPD